MANNVKDTGGNLKRTQKSIDAVSLFMSFFDNSHRAYVARKAERLSTAIHVVTGFINPDEPIRTLLRRLSLEVIELATDERKLAEVGPESFSARCAQLGTILQTAESAGLVSHMNAELIVGEYASLASFIGERYSQLRSQVLAVPDNTPPPLSFKSMKDTMSYRSNYKSQSSSKGQFGTSDRKSMILSLFDAKDSISIKDVVQAMPGMSEKTIQRELVSLVSDGTLIREGERRWSVYKLHSKSDLHQEAGLGSIPQ